MTTIDINSVDPKSAHNVIMTHQDWHNLRAWMEIVNTYMHTGMAAMELLEKRIAALEKQRKWWRK